MTTPENPDTLTDWRGNTYTIGDRVLYPRTSGRSCEMQEGRVLKVNRKDGTKVSSITIQPYRSSRHFGRWDGKAVGITIIDNITKVMEPERVVAMPTQSPSELENHLSETHGERQSINAAKKVMEKAIGERYWSHRATPEQEAQYHDLLAAAHELAHNGESTGLVHVHDHNLRSHDFEQRVERTERRVRTIGWKHKTSGAVWDKERYVQATGMHYGFDNSPPDWRNRDRHSYGVSPYNGYDLAGRRIVREPWVSEWEKITEEYDHEFHANYCKYCDVKMDQNNHGRKALIEETICKKNAPNNEESE